MRVERGVWDDATETATTGEGRTRSARAGHDDGDDDDDDRREEEYPIDDTLSLSTRFVSYPTSDLDFSGEDFTIMFNGRLRVERGVLDNEDDDYDGREEDYYLIDDTLSLLMFVGRDSQWYMFKLILRLRTSSTYHHD